ncbi:MAG TPA: hypothetical protein VGU26_05605, partial [Gaiellaceae bacterium]|nr:hypothetical protein [Gaiellaceae bacterium]
MSLTAEEVARRAGTTVERVRKLAELGILRPSRDSEEPFGGGDALRAQLVQELDAFGIPAEQV